MARSETNILKYCQVKKFLNLQIFTINYLILIASEITDEKFKTVNFCSIVQYGIRITSGE